MKIAFFSSDAISIKPLEFLRDTHELVCIVSNPDKPKGRGNRLSPNDVAQWALDNSIELLRPAGKPDAAVVERMRELGAELALVMAYGHILKDNILNFGKYPCLNLHASVLPELRGASPIETAIALGKRETGVSLMKISREMDAGDVADIERVSIDDCDSSKTLREKISAASVEILRRDLPLLARGELAFSAQDKTLATYSRKLCKDDARLDFRHSARTLLNRIRAFGFGILHYQNDQIKVFDARICEELKSFPRAGEILEASSDGLKIACSEGAVVFASLQKPCAKAMGARDFFAGYKMQKGAIVESSDNAPLLR